MFFLLCVDKGPKKKTKKVFLKRKRFFKKEKRFFEK